MKVKTALMMTGLLAAGGFTALMPLAQTTPSGTEPWVAPARDARKQNPIPPDGNAIAQGKELYVSSCLPCHGATGSGDGPAAASLERNGAKIAPGNLSDSRMWQQTNGTIFWKITEGNSPMPAFGEALTEEQRWQIVNYVRTLAAKPEVAARK